MCVFGEEQQFEPDVHVALQTLQKKGQSSYLHCWQHLPMSLSSKTGPIKALHTGRG